jgi:putative endonuclease
MPKVFRSDKQKIGKLGEEIAKRFLTKHGYFILEENYTKKYGEMDLIAKKDNVIHFVEVKSVSRGTYDPLQNVHPSKLRRLSRVIQVYLLNIKVPRETSFNEIKWQFDVITVKINEKDRIGTVKHIKDIII